MSKRAKKQRQKRRERQRNNVGSAPPAEAVDTSQLASLSQMLPAETAPDEVVAIVKDALEAQPLERTEPPAPTESGVAPVLDEHRSTQRTSLSVEIHLGSESHFFTGLSGDISEGGIFVSTYRELEPGSEIDLEFSLPGDEEPVHARGEVRWLREHSSHQSRGVGIAFEELTDDDRSKIHRFCTIRPPLYYDDVG